MADGIADWDWAQDIRSAGPRQQCLIATRNIPPIGFVQIIDPALEPEHYGSEVPANQRAIDIFIGEARYLNQGLGTTIMQQAIAPCFDNPAVTGIRVDLMASNTRAHRFYARLDFQFLTAQTFGTDDCHAYFLARAD